MFYIRPTKRKYKVIPEKRFSLETSILISYDYVTKVSKASKKKCDDSGYISYRFDHWLCATYPKLWKLD